ncbi:hypothetical protein ILUMI_05207 [Ignelater luminosus]|uniref:HAT C-terminal dimerisation domain-containing protein n=1 Tax=Ignelater luminosus TaxID=2038154 RepID=A0A8K0DCD4_IGNLU|nr:hypothetical protein ILUMI_05207 [Ignelater luminosus]
MSIAENTEQPQETKHEALTIEFVQGHKSSEELKLSCKEFVAIYEDVSEKELEMECLHLTEYLKIVQLSNCLSMIVTSCSGERSFSKLKRITNELRSTMIQGRLTSLSLMSIECDVLKDIDFEEVMDGFACLKYRRVPL